MDLTTVTRVQPLTEVTARGVTRLEGVGAWEPGDAWLGGGTWLYSQPQPGVRRLLDLGSLGWPALTVTAGGVDVAATCSIAELARHSALFRRFARWLLMSFKVWNHATVGGNLTLGLPAGAMTSLAAGLGAGCEIRDLQGARRWVAADGFVTGAGRVDLGPGEYLRTIRIPEPGRVAARQQSLAAHGRSAVLVVGQRRDTFALTVTASTVRPVRIEFPAVPGAGELREVLEHRLTDDLWHDDVHGDRDWRRHLTFALAADVRAELAR